MQVECEWVEVPVDGGSMAAYVAAPGGRRGTLVMLQEIFGVNEAMQEKARRFAAAGYTVVVPDLFWRLSPRVSLGYGEEDRKQGFAYAQRFDMERGVQDVHQTIRFCKTLRDGNGRVGLVGFCLGGKIAILAAAMGGVEAVASFYGVQPDQSLEAFGAISAPLQFHVGDRDAHIPMASVESVMRTLQDRPEAEVYIYPGAQHAFFNPLRGEGIYDPGHASTAMNRAIEMFSRTLN